MTEIFTVRDAIARSASWLQTRGIETPRLDAELLLAHVLQCKRLDLFMAPERPLSQDETGPYRTLLQRRAKHEPIAYILGDIGFWKHDFYIDRRALIPRPETEGILDVVLQAAGDKRDAPLRVVDVGTGSGVLAISLALEFPNAQVVAIDISDDALALTRENAERHEVLDRVHPVRGDLLDRLIQRGSKSDIIVSNPPYIAETERKIMGAGVEQWEPYGALFSGEDGLQAIDRLLTQIPHTLDEGGIFVMEFGSPQGDAIRARAQRMFRRWRVQKDFSQHDRLLIVDAPGVRTWSDATSTASALEGESEGASTPPQEKSAADDAHIEAFDETRARLDAMRYGGADGAQPLPEIDLHADVAPDPNTEDPTT